MQDKAYKRQYYLDNIEKLRTRSRAYFYAHREEYRDNVRHLRMEVILSYGGKCVCCGESQFYFLSLDHINNDGAEHRQEVKGNIYLWAKKNDFPDTLQVLCYNCNLAKQFSGLGHCPHEDH